MDVEFTTMLHAGPATFFGQPLVRPDILELKRTGAEVAILGVPWDEGNGGRNGANYGPRAVRDVSHWFLSYQFESSCDLFRELSVVDCGDVPVLPSDSPRTMEIIEDFTGRILDAGVLPILVGGNHSISIGSVRALTKRVSRMGYLAVDAHIDTAKDMGGALLTSASPTARAAEHPQVPRGRAAVVGAHGSLNPRDQVEYARELGVTIYPMSHMQSASAATITSRALTQVGEDVDAVYASFDIDSIDAAFVPGTGTPEPGGFTSREAQHIARVIGASRPTAFDVVELAPAYDLSGISARLVCSLLVNFLTAFLRGSSE